MKQLKYIGWMICSLFFLVSDNKVTTKKWNTEE